MLLDRIKNLIKERYPKNSFGYLESLRLRAISVDKQKKTIKYTISTPVELSDSTEKELLSYIKEFSPQGFKSLLEITIDKMDAEITKRMIWDFINESCPSVYMELCGNRDCIHIENKSDRISILFKVTKKIKDLLVNGALEKIEKFFSSFTSCNMDFFINEIPSDDIDLKEALTHLDKERERTVEAYISQPERKIKIDSHRDLIGKLPNINPQYIIDILPSQAEVVVCGTMGNFSHRDAKNKEMTICKFTLHDFSSTVNVVYFARNEKNLSALLNIYPGDEIVLRGKPQINSYDGKLELLANAIGLCKISSQKHNLDEYKPVPPEYLKVSPIPFNSDLQTGVFNENENIPEPLNDKTFVVFDLETTGFQPQIDKILEIGAVKIINGKIVETFSTLLNPQMPIPANIIQLTGINDDMVKDKPLFAEVCGDFYKFTNGAYLVAHNISFDYPFLDYYARPCGYLFNNNLIDTLVLAKNFFKDKPSKARPKDNSLETLAKFFDFKSGDFHRAMFDSLITSKLFIKFLTLNDSLLDRNL